MIQQTLIMLIYDFSLVCLKINGYSFLSINTESIWGGVDDQLLSNQWGIFEGGYFLFGDILKLIFLKIPKTGLKVLKI